MVKSLLFAIGYLIFLLVTRVNVINADICSHLGYACADDNECCDKFCKGLTPTTYGICNKKPYTYRQY
uniref:Teratocyte protein CftICK-II n=1 Tax=Cotesia flavipes TaxID=89805 RepID=TP2_COTFL|nr:RecName: Full=Teratocyte protein CftICK-II; Flags: Precursor [Cotesia flavipes]UEP64314.1 teratocyte uncharacterized I [Cotesia flavipes]